MFTNVENILKKRADEIVFLELKEGKKIEFGNTVLDQEIPLPIMIKDIVDKVNGVSEEDIKLNSIFSAMCFVIGMDSAFPHKESYMKFLTSIYDDMSDRLMKIGYTAIEQAKFIDGVLAFKASYEFDNENHEALFHYARCLEEYAKEADHDAEVVNIVEGEAFDVYSELITKHPEISLYYYYMAFHLVNRKSYKAAKDLWLKAMEMGVPGELKDDIIKNLGDLKSRIDFEDGYTLILEGMPQEGLVKLLPLTDENPDWWNLMFFIGLAHRQLEQFDEALYYYQKTLTLNTGHVDTFNEIALCYMTMNLFDKAEEYFKEALKVDINNAEILCNLGIVYMRTDNLKAAREMIEKSLAINPQDEVTNAWNLYLTSLEDSE